MVVRAATYFHRRVLASIVLILVVGFTLGCSEFDDRGMHLTPEAPTYSMRAHGGLPAYAGGV